MVSLKDLESSLSITQQIHFVNTFFPIPLESGVAGQIYMWLSMEKHNMQVFLKLTQPLHIPFRKQKGHLSTGVPVHETNVITRLYNP